MLLRTVIDQSLLTFVHPGRISSILPDIHEYFSQVTSCIYGVRLVLFGTCLFTLGLYPKPEFQCWSLSNFTKITCGYQAISWQSAKDAQIQKVAN